MNRKRIGLGLALSLFFIYLTLYDPDLSSWFSGDITLLKALLGSTRLNFHQVWYTICEAHLGLLFLVFALYPIHVYLRAHRWSVIIQPTGQLRTIDGFGLHLIGYLANAVLPLKAGEVVRGMLLAKRLGISRSTALATVLFERMIDLFSLLFIIGLIWFVFPIPRRFTLAALMIGLLSLIIFAVFLYFGTAQKPFRGWIGRLLGRRLLGRRIRRFIEQFAEGFAALRSTHHLGVVVFETIVLYILYALQMFALMAAFQLTTTYPLISASPIVASFVLLVIDSIAIAVPSAPSAVGTFHAIGIFGLSLFDVPSDAAAGFVIIQHALVVVFSLTFGLAAMWREGVKLSDLKELPQKQY